MIAISLGVVGMKRWLVLRGIVEARIAPPLFTRSLFADEAHTGRPVTMEIMAWICTSARVSYRSKRRTGRLLTVY